MDLNDAVKLLRTSQWWTHEQIEQRQRDCLKRIVLHHAQHAPYFKQRLESQGLRAEDVATLEGLKQLKPMTKRDIQQAERFHSEGIPNNHLPIRRSQTSGRTGEPVTILKTEVNNLWYCAQTAREHEWWGQDYSWRLSSIRAIHTDYEENDRWGSPLAVNSGPTQGIPLKWNVQDQLEKLRAFQPEMLNIHAGVLQAMCAYWGQHGYDLNLKHIKNTGETLSQEVRQQVKEVTGVTVKDQYSSSEVGLISMNCEHTDQQHIQVETLLVEILNEQGQACQPGELGRVVITDYYNTVSPMIRYDIGDYARVGEPCQCGRHSPTLSEIRGRERGLFRRPNGDRFWPTAGQYAAAKIVKINQWQIIQHSLDDIEYKIVTDLPLTEDQRDQLLEIFRQTLGFDCVRITEYRTQLPTDGKYEESICLIS